MATSKFIVNLETAAGAKVTTGTVQILPYGGTHPGDALALSHEGDGVWSRAAVNNGEYSLYYNGTIHPKYQRFWVGENQLSKIAESHNNEGKLILSGLAEETKNVIPIRNQVATSNLANGFPLSWDESTSTLSIIDQVTIFLGNGAYTNINPPQSFNIGNDYALVLSVDELAVGDLPNTLTVIEWTGESRAEGKIVLGYNRSGKFIPSSFIGNIYSAFIINNLLPVATNEVNGLQSKEDKEKFDKINSYTDEQGRLIPDAYNNQRTNVLITYVNGKVSTVTESIDGVAIRVTTVAYDSEGKINGYQVSDPRTSVVGANKVITYNAENRITNVEEVL